MGYLYKKNSILISAKFEEFDSKIPTVSQLNKYDGFRYSNRDFIRVEMLVLKCVDFGLTEPTVAHFAEYYTMFVVLTKDHEGIPNIWEKAHKLIVDLLDFSLKGKSLFIFMNYLQIN